MMRADQRNMPPEMIRAFAPGVTAARLADIPHDCAVACVWVPVPHGVPGAYEYGPEFALKYPNRWCPHHRPSASTANAEHQ
jgi:hypothetical protein